MAALSPARHALIDMDVLGNTSDFYFGAKSALGSIKVSLHENGARLVEGDTFGAVGKGLTLEARLRYGPRD
jgi:hypothetical protein